MVERLDIVIFGATGFTGKYAVKSLHKLAKENGPLSWGVAGRSEAKLTSLLNDLKEKTDDDVSAAKTIIADVGDEESLLKMCSQAKVVVNCCGPYRFYGEPVVKACIAAGTHHVDVSGEPQYMERIQLEYHKAAQDRGVYIVSACGFDSVPTDLGVVFLQDKFDGTLNSVETYLSTEKKVNTNGAVLHYGTWESAIYGLAHADELPPLRSKLFPQRLPDFQPKLKAKSLLTKTKEVGNMWTVPFLGSDRSVVMRSQRHFYETDKKRPVQIQTYMTVKSFFALLIMTMFGIIFALLTKLNFGRYLLLKYPRVFSGGWVSHEGPTEESMEATQFSVTLVGRGWSSDEALAEPTDQHADPPTKVMVARVSGVNPGYGATCTMLNMCALTILKEADKMPDKGGVFPPGAAFAKTSLIEHLQKNGITFELISSKL